MIMKFSEQVLHQLKSLMQKEKITQRELAAEMGVTEARVSHIFAEGSNLTLHSVDEIHVAITHILNRRPPAKLFIELPFEVTR